MRTFGQTLVLGACAALAACGGKADRPTPEETKARLAALPAPYNTADLAVGEKKWLMCKSCHTLVEGGANLTGPHLYGVFGRKAASLPDFKYSDALKAKGVTWDAAAMDAWIADPRAYAPGTKMSFVGIQDAKERTDLIAYLMVQTGYQAP